MKWQGCIALQPADMIAFDTFKLLDGTIHATTARMRRSLRAILGKALHIEGRYFSEAVMVRLKRMNERKVANGLTDDQAVQEEFGSIAPRRDLFYF
jgi:hypothetical protein